MLTAGVERGSPAAKAALRGGDLIVGYAGTAIANFDDPHRVPTEERVGRTAPIVIIRGTERLELAVVPVPANPD